MSRTLNRILGVWLSLTLIFTFTYFQTVKVEAGQVSSVSAMANEGDYVVYSYTGGVQSFTAPFYAIYKYEIYGGGAGGKTVGYFKQTAGTTYYICIGRNGEGYYDASYNGGGAGKNWSDCGAYSGGGATSVTTTNRGELKNFSSYRSEVLLVAGGQGGSAHHNEGLESGRGDGGAGGGLNGSSGGQGSGGSQYGGYAFGQGGSGGQIGAGGGGGWYGGYNGTYIGGGGGGSGYIGGCSSFSFNGTTYSPSTTTKGKTSGHGYAVVTLVAFLITITESGTAVAPEDANFTSESTFAYLNFASFKVQKQAIALLSTPSTSDLAWSTIYECPDIGDGAITKTDSTTNLEVTIASKTLFNGSAYKGTILLTIPVNENTSGYFYRIIGYMDINYTDSSASDYVTCQLTTADINYSEVVVNEDKTGILEATFNDGTSVEYNDMTVKSLDITADITGALSFVWQYRYEGNNDDNVWTDVVSGISGRIVVDNYDDVTLTGTSTLKISDVGEDVVYDGTNIDADDGIYYRLLITHSAGSTASNTNSLNNQQTFITSKVMKLYINGNKIKHVYLVTYNNEGNEIFTEIKGIVFNMPTGDSVNRRDYLYYGY